MAREDYVLKHQELIENPTARVPICLVLDASPSMGATHPGDAESAIEALNRGVEAFYDQISSDEMARYAADIAMVSFSDRAHVEVDFGSVERGPQRIRLHDGGGTSIGSGVELGLNLLEQRKAQFKATGVDYYQPWLVLMTDGAPTDRSHEAAAIKVADMVKNKRLTVFPIGVGAEADLSALAPFSPNRPPLKLKGLNFREFFEWLARSVSTTSRSTPGEKVQLDTDGIKGWGEL